MDGAVASWGRRWNLLLESDKGPRCLQNSLLRRILEPAGRSRLPGSSPGMVAGLAHGAEGSRNRLHLLPYGRTLCNGSAAASAGSESDGNDGPREGHDG